MITGMNLGEGLPALKLWITPEELYYAGEDGKKKALFSDVLELAQMPHIFRHIALMPDAHVGKGTPIGGVVALKGAICPAAVGVDIGCGMNAVKTSIPMEALLCRDVQIEVSRAIRKMVPVGEKGHQDNDHIKKQAHKDLAVLVDHEKDNSDVFIDKFVGRRWKSQLGSLGGGNHFLELDFDEDGNIWIVIHSGSRNPGKTLAEHYIKLAAKMCQQWGVRVSANYSTLPVDSPEGKSYIKAMNTMLDYALFNREIMMDRTLDVLRELFGGFTHEDHINVHHNYASIENHFGQNVWVHRKGATRARLGERLVIPGNMGDGTAICVGKGNEDSYCTSSHGAGRALGRKEAQRVLDEDAERAYLAERNILVSAGREGFLEEAPSAYKNFDEVLDRQSDLVEVTNRLTPLIVIKG